MPTEKYLIDVNEKVDVSSEVNFIWSIANRLRGPYQSDKYKDVIIPMVILRRFECALAPTKSQVLSVLEKHPDYPDKALSKISKLQFFNKSKFDLQELTNDPDHIAENLKSYLNGFDPKVQEIFKNLEFEKQIDKMDKHNRLYSIVKAFSEVDLDPSHIDNIKMGYIFEDLIRKFSENAEAGDHYTGRDLVALATALALAEGCEDLFDDYKIVTVADQAAGTGGFLFTAYNFIKKMNPTADIRLYGQEINPESEAMCVAEFLIRGQDANNIQLADTMKSDCFPDTKFRLLLENPPFGQAWKGKEAGDGVEAAVIAENAKGSRGRFPAGLPADMQLLFFQSAIDKLDENGRAAIFSNGSPLFNGSVASGDSQIRRWLLENDYLEAIIQLGTDEFYNTGITTYINILSKNKRPERKGKVQLIDASSFQHKLRKALGNKKNEVTREDRKQIVELYSNFEENEFSKIFDVEEFLYREYTVMQPMQRNYAITQERIDELYSNGSLNTIFDPIKYEELLNKDELDAKEKKRLKKLEKNEPLYYKIRNALESNVKNIIYKTPKEFDPILKKVLVGIDLTKAQYDKVKLGLSVMDKSVEIQKNRNGIIYDPSTKDPEMIRLNQDVEEYMKKEVLPYIPDAKWFFEEDLSKKPPIIRTGAEIPFNRYFYKYQNPDASEDLMTRFLLIEKSLETDLADLLGGNGS